MLNLVLQPQLEEFKVLVHDALEEIRNEAKESREKNVTEKLFLVEQLKKKDEELKNINKELIQLKDNYSMVADAVSEILSRVSNLNSPKIFESKYRAPTEIVNQLPSSVSNPEVPLSLVDNVAPNGDIKFNINELPAKQAEDIIKKSLEKPAVTKKKSKFFEEYPSTNDDAGKCYTCMKWVKISEPETSKNPKGYKYIEGRCPYCGDAVVENIEWKNQ